MPITTNTAFDTHNASIKKWPLYVVVFDSVATKFCNHIPGSATGTHKRYVQKISGLEQTVKPEKGQSTIGAVKITLLDKSQEVSALIAADSVQLHRKKVIIYAGYKGMNESDLLTRATFWITGCKRSSDGLSWEITATDPQKWMQKSIYRTATESSTLTIAGNAINIILGVLTSSDSGTNSDYDLGDDDYGCGLDSDTVDIAGIEAVRDDWFWDQQFFLEFTIKEPFEAKKFIESILQLLQCYPGIDGNGKYKIIPFKPPMATTGTLQSLTESNMVGIPGLDLNFPGVINQVDFFFDWDNVDDEFDSREYFIDAISFASRGPGSSPLKIESKGVHSTHATASRAMHYAELINGRAAACFNRNAEPPPRIKADCLFSQNVIDAGDIISFTHGKVIDAEAGTLGLSASRMEVVKRSIDWLGGQVSLDLQDTGFNKGTYSSFSPYMTVVSGTSGTAFTISAADAAQWTAGWEAKVLNHVTLEIATVTILTIDTGTGDITCDDIGQTPAAGWFLTFADYDECTADQQLYAFMADGSDYLGAANDTAHLLTP